MKESDVPQDTSSTYGGHRKVIYAQDRDGRYEKVRSSGWAVEEYATTMAVTALRDQQEQAKKRVISRESSVLEYYMYRQRLDVTALSQATGFFKWQIRRHFKPRQFRSLPEEKLKRYAEALGIRIELLESTQLDDE
jgi:hypothetical protein